MTVAIPTGPAGHSVTRPVEMARNTAHDLAPILRQLTVAMTARGLVAIRRCHFATTGLARVRNIPFRLFRTVKPFI